MGDAPHLPQRRDSMPVKKSKATVNIKKNRLTITVAPKIDKKSIDNLYTEIRFGVADLQPGFDVITDLSACTLAALSSVPTFRKITKHLVDSRVGRVVRVIDESKIIKKQLINMAGRVQGYKAEVFNSLEAADEFLSQREEEPALAFGLLNQPVSFTYKGESGVGDVDSLSVKGCEIKKLDVAIENGSEISLAIQFDPFEELLEELTVEGKVIAIDTDRFTVSFGTLEENLRERLWERLVYESQCEVR